MEVVVDFRLIEISLELDSLKEFLSSIDEQETFLSKVRWNELLEEIKLKSLEGNDDEWNIASQKYHYLTEHVYPKALRGSYIVSLWATFESSLTEIAKFIQTRKRIELKLSDIRGNNILDQSKKYFAHILNFDLMISDESWQKIEEIYLIRNCFAHTNGRIDALKQNDRERLFKVKRVTSDICQMYGYVFLEKVFLHNSFNLVDTELRRIIEQVREWDDKVEAGRDAS